GKLESARGQLTAENRSLEEKVAAAKRELGRLEEEARARLAVVPTPARLSGAKLRDALPVEKMTPAESKRARATIRDVRFADDDNAVRVLVSVAGDADYTVLHADAKTAILRIAQAELPRKLERTLDVAAFKGPLRSVS